MKNLVEICDKKDSEKSYKWSEVSRGCRPFGVADMDVKIDKRIRIALEKVIEAGDFGYGKFEKYYESVIKWIEHRYDWKINPEWLTYSPGVMVGIGVLIELLTNENDKIVILSPVYSGFYSIIAENKRKLIECPMIFDNGKYEVDFKQFEHCIEDAKLFIMCNPHNPLGKVWSKEEIVSLKEICKKKQVSIISDEIHADLTYEPFSHIPFLKFCEDYKEKIYVAFSASKAFNMASLYTANYIIPNDDIRNRFKALFHGEPNLLGAEATKTAYAQCEDWLSELIKYIKKNVEFVTFIVSEKCPEIGIVTPKATYLLWLDCRCLKMTEEQLMNFFREKACMDVNAGSHYGSSGKGYVRINIACKREKLEKCIRLFCDAVIEHRRLLHE